jgi:acyl-CoA reductase-like NAD-dependent aldehyde dehydrogenase
VKVVNPATGAELADLPTDDAASVAAAFARARAAQVEWAGRPIRERVDIIRKFRAQTQYRIDDLAGIMTAETGKPITQSRNELEGLLPRIDFFLDNVERTVDDEVVLLDDDAGIEEVISHEPLGVVANISAWNYPYFVGSNVFVPALLTGNAVLYKPSEHAALTGRAIAEMIWGAGVPVDVFALVIGAGDVGAALLDQPLDGVFFTGSYATGRSIAAALAGSMARVQLELGGKDPVYVCDDVDVAIAAASLADGAFYNDGQSCCSVERIYVHDRIHDEFVERFVEAVAGFVAGDPTDEKTYLGPLTRAAQADVLDAQVADAVQHGATLRTGGARHDGGTGGAGVWFAPTVLTEVTHEMAVMRDESFGPIIGIQRVADDDEALALMNDTDFGLTAGVYAADEVRATDLLRRVDAGTAYWNCCDRVSPRLPWSGRHHSGVGSTLSTYGITTFTKPKAWHLRQP